MSEPFIGEIRLMAFDYPPVNWARCDGQLLPVNQNMLLYALIGSVYGGDGINDFALPDLRGRAIVHAGLGYFRGLYGGLEQVPLTESQIGSHSHTAKCTTETSLLRDKPKGKYFAPAEASVYSTGLSNLQALNSNSVSEAGSGLPHYNIQPSLALNYCIAMDGTFPSRS